MEVATLALLYGVYEVLRGQADATPATARAHTEQIVELERDLHLFVERPLQEAVNWLPGLPTLLGVAYIGLHFLGTAAFLIWLHRRHATRYPLVRNTFVGATAVAVFVYVAYPVAPPRLAQLGFVDTVSDHAGVNLSSDVLGSLYNPFAAVPSLHFGYALLVGVTVALIARRPLLRAAAWAYPVAMLFVIVATGNHFFLDAAAGAAAVGIGFAAASWVDARAKPARRRQAVRGCAVALS